MVLVLGGLGGFRPSVGGQTQELGQDQKTVVQRLLRILLSLLLDLSNSIGLVLLVCLLDIRLDRGNLGTVLSINLLVLGQLLLQSCHFGLERVQVVDLLLLVGIDDLELDELLGGFAFGLVLVDQSLGLGSIALNADTG